jgi:mannonate dehydratase
VAAFCATLERVAAAGLEVVCYNFMPVVDWTRTSLRHPMPSGGLALRFDMADFVAYDALILGRPGAERDYPAALLAEAEARRAAMTPEAAVALERNVIAGLPGAEGSHDRAGIAASIARYGDLGPEDLRANLWRSSRRSRPWRSGWACGCASIRTTRPFRCSGCPGW